MFQRAERWKADSEADRKDTDEDDGEGCNYLSQYMSASEPQAAIIYDAPKHACDGINILSENKRDLIDENITKHTSCRSCDGTHDYVHPDRETGLQAFLDTYNGEESDSYGIEDEEGVVQAYKLVSEQDNEDQGNCRDDDIRGLMHPEWRET